VVVLKVLDSKVSAISEAQTVAAPVTGKIGQTVKDGDFTFVVKSVKCGMTTSGGPVPSKATDEFCAVDLSVTNGGKDVNTFDDGQVEGFSAGRRHVANSEASMRANSYTNVFPKVVKPGQVLRSVVLIDVAGLSGGSLATSSRDGWSAEPTSVGVRVTGPNEASFEVHDDEELRASGFRLMARCRSTVMWCG
jgi:hypothetical protein